MLASDFLRSGNTSSVPIPARRRGEWRHAPCEAILLAGAWRRQSLRDDPSPQLLSYQPTRPGFEPGQREPKSLVLPLHYRVSKRLWVVSPRLVPREERRDAAI